MKREIKWRPLPLLERVGNEGTIGLMRRQNNILGMRLAVLEREREQALTVLREVDRQCWPPPTGRSDAYAVAVNAAHVFLMKLEQEHQTPKNNEY